MFFDIYGYFPVCNTLSLLFYIISDLKMVNLYYFHIFFSKNCYMTVKFKDLNQKGTVLRFLTIFKPKSRNKTPKLTYMQLKVHFHHNNCNLWCAKVKLSKYVFLKIVIFSLFYLIHMVKIVLEARARRLSLRTGL